MRNWKCGRRLLTNATMATTIHTVTDLLNLTHFKLTVYFICCLVHQQYRDEIWNKRNKLKHWWERQKLTVNTSNLMRRFHALIVCLWLMEFPSDWLIHWLINANWLPDPFISTVTAVFNLIQGDTINCSFDERWGQASNLPRRTVFKMEEPDWPPLTQQRTNQRRGGTSLWPVLVTR